MDSDQPIVNMPRQRIIPAWMSFLMFAGFVTILVSAGFSALYNGKAYPGVSVYGAYIGGLSRAEAIKAVSEDVESYQRQSVPISYAATTVNLIPVQAGADFHVEKAVDEALQYGRRGNWSRRVREQARAVVGRPTTYSALTLDAGKLSPLLLLIDKSVNRAVANANFNVSGSSVTVTPGQAGRRLNLGALTQEIVDRFSIGSTLEIVAPIADLPPSIDTPSLESVRSQATAYVSGPLQIAIGDRSFTLGEDQIVAWFNVTRPSPRLFENTRNVADLRPANTPVTLSLESSKIEAYVAELAAKTDQEGQNAALSIEDGRAVVFRPSRDGLALDQPKAVEDIKVALSKPANGRTLALKVAVKKPEVTEQGLNDLGIKELISQGVSYFPGSVPARVKNIRLGAALYNGVLVKPGEEFSFNKYFINVNAENGWEPGLSIVGNKIYPIFGGGICQVSSTAYRAALLAGLPITERVNHSYAISYYSAPFGPPGVDATVYNPGVDFKFKNDTGSHILMQTRIVGTTLYFDYYGTKNKSGRIRGPFFIDGSMDDKKPSTTVFYRDVLDLAGNVLKTDSVVSRYKSSLDFTKVDTP